MAIETTKFINYNTSRVHSAQTSNVTAKKATILQNLNLKKM